MGTQLCVVGSLNADLVVRVARAPAAGETVTGGSFARHPGGKGANQACAAARLAGAETRVCLIGLVGADPEGAWLRDGLASDGVDVTGVAVDPDAPTGVALITVEASGQNRIVVVPGANGELSPKVLGRQHGLLTGAGVILLQLEIPLPTVQTAARMGREKRALVILDPAPARPLPGSLLALCDYVMPNAAELCVLDGRPADDRLSREDAGAAARRLVARGAGNVIVKLGGDGALLVTPSGEHHWPAPAVAVVDTTAAGDAFAGAFAVALAEGRSPDEAGRFACAAGALTVTCSGAQSALPRRAEVDALLAAPSATP